MMILMKHNVPEINEIMLVEHSSKCSQTIGDFVKKVSQRATDPALRSQIYINVCTREGVVLKNAALLKQCFPPLRKGLYHVVIAIPRGNTCNQAIRLARPILWDDQVIRMVRK